jgi:hypothetical protein
MSLVNEVKAPTPDGPREATAASDGSLSSTCIGRRPLGAKALRLINEE